MDVGGVGGGGGFLSLSLSSFALLSALPLVVVVPAAEVAEEEDRARKWLQEKRRMVFRKQSVHTLCRKQLRFSLRDFHPSSKTLAKDVT